MNEAHVTLVGNVATAVDYRMSGSGVPVARFRLASTVRRFDAQRGGWADGHTSFYTVWAWRTLAVNVASSVSRGEPVVVQGQLRVQEGEREGRRYVSADLTASTVGHDLTRGTAAFVRVSRARPDRPEPASQVAGQVAGAATGAAADRAGSGADGSGGREPVWEGPAGAVAEPGGAAAGVSAGGAGGFPEEGLPGQRPAS